MKRSKILEIHEKLINNVNYFNELLASSKKINEQSKSLNSTITPLFDNIKQFNFNKDNLLSGIIFSLKDLFLTKDILTTAGSKFYKNFIPTYNSEVYERLIKSGAILVGKDNCDEFGIGGSGLESAYGIVHNYSDPTCTTSGSSSGSCNKVGNDEVIFSIGTDTVDSIRRPACFTNCIGYKPTYGLISRYGLFSFSPSFDTVGICTKYITDCAIVADNLIGYDEKDFTSQKFGANFFNNLHELKKINFFVIKNIENYLSPEIKKIYLSDLKKIKDNGHIINEVEIENKYLDILKTIYISICYSEGVSSHGVDTGVIFGGSSGKNINSFDKIVTNNRTNGYSKNIKRRFIIGALCTLKENYENIFIKAKKIRTILIEKYNSILEQCDALLLPSSSSFAPKIKQTKNNKNTIADEVLKIANIGGYPSISIPTNKYKKLFWGLNITSKQFSDQNLFNIGLTLENIFANNEGKNS